MRCNDIRHTGIGDIGTLASTLENGDRPFSLFRFPIGRTTHASLPLYLSPAVITCFSTSTLGNRIEKGGYGGGGGGVSDGQYCLGNTDGTTRDIADTLQLCTMVIEQ